jgi:glycerophosphoryl diester phosphodiesterase
VLRREGAVDRVCLGSELDALAGRLVEVLPEACHFYPRDALTALVLAIKSGARR